MVWKALPSVVAGVVLCWAPYGILYSQYLVIWFLALGCYGLCPVIIGRTPQRTLLAGSLLPHLMSTFGLLGAHPARGYASWWFQAIVLFTLTVLVLLPLTVLITSLQQPIEQPNEQEQRREELPIASSDYVSAPTSQP